MTRRDLAQRMEQLLRLGVERAPTSGLTLAPGFRRYGRDDLHLYIDGAAERYLGYSFDRLVRAEAATPKDVFVMELYHFGKAADAYGLWSTDSEGERVGIGQRSAYGSGLLQFWRGPYFARIYHLKYQERTRETVIALGRSLAECIGEDGAAPALLAVLPREGVKGEPVFFHEQAVLNHLHYVGEANLLRLGPRTDAVFADYEGKGEKGKLLVVGYAGSRASEARRAFISGFLEVEPARGVRVVRLENGLWSGISGPQGRVLRVVFDAGSEELARRLLVP
jgi:hypothetical protein